MYVEDRKEKQEDGNPGQWHQARERNIETTCLRVFKPEWRVLGRDRREC
jgi:hypothetical protein